jgi:hypothetical protein
MVLIGHGYAPDTAVTILFGDGAGTTTSALTTATGDLLTSVPVPFDDRGGTRTVVVNGADSSVSSAPITIVPLDDNVPGMVGFGLG